MTYELSAITGLHNSASWKGQTDQHEFAAGASLFRCTLKEILKRLLIIRGRTLQHLLK